VHADGCAGNVGGMTEPLHPEELPPTAEPFADPDPEALADQRDESDLDPDDRTVEPADLEEDE